MKRHLYLVAYDVAEAHRLRQVLEAVKAWRASGQRSVAECWMSPGERDSLAGTLASVLDDTVDRLHVLRLDPRQPALLFGLASQATERPFIIG
jgi:CRISPR-associated protein Cas2